MCDCALLEQAQRLFFVRLLGKKETTTPSRIKHDMPVVAFHARVVTLLLSSAAASLAALACLLLTPEVHIHGGLWPRG